MFKSQKGVRQSGIQPRATPQAIRGVWNEHPPTSCASLSNEYGTCMVNVLKKSQVVPSWLESGGGGWVGSTEDPMWGHPMPVLGALSPFLEPFRGHLSPKVDEIFQK